MSVRADSRVNEYVGRLPDWQQANARLSGCAAQPRAREPGSEDHSRVNSSDVRSARSPPGHILTLPATPRQAQGPRPGDRAWPPTRAARRSSTASTDLRANTGWVSVGTDHDTSALAAQALRRWWRCDGSARCPAARRLLICADSGGSNAARARAWKVELARLAAETELEVTCCHYPPGTSRARPSGTR